MDRSHTNDRIFDDRGKAVRIEGRVETGHVNHSRRRRSFVGSTYSCGKARDHQWAMASSLGRQSSSR